MANLKDTIIATNFQKLLQQDGYLQNGTGSNVNLTVSGSINTMHGNTISASGNLHCSQSIIGRGGNGAIRFSSHASNGNTAIIVKKDASDFVLGDVSNNDDVLNMTFRVAGNDLIRFGDFTNNNILCAGDISSSGDIFATDVIIGPKGTTKATNMELTVAGDISASGVVYARRFQSSGSATHIEVVDSLDVSGNITASGNISASGTGYNHIGGFITGSSAITASDMLYAGNTVQAKYSWMGDNPGLSVGTNMLGLGVASLSPWETLNYGNIALVQYHSGDSYLNSPSGQTTNLAQNMVNKLTVGTNGKIIIGTGMASTVAPEQELQVAGEISSSEDIYAGKSSSYGVVLTSPGGTQYRLKVDNDGVLSTESI